MAHQLTSRDYDVIIKTSQYSKSSYPETSTRINYPCGTLKHTLMQKIVFKKKA